MSPTRIRRELLATFALALPIMVGQVGQIAMAVTDSLMVGHLGQVPLAASAFAGGVINVCFLFGVGLFSGIAVFTAQHRGADEPHQVAEVVRHGVGIAVLTGILAGVVLTFVSQFGLHIFRQPPEIEAIVRPFWQLIAWSLLPAFVFQGLKQYSEGLGFAWKPMIILLAAVILNVVLNFVFIYGLLGFPALGLTGAGLATLISRALAAAALAILVLYHRDYSQTWPKKWLAKISWPSVHRLLRLGAPVGAGLVFESGAFAMSAVMMGWIGTADLAAHQVALSCAAVTFMFPLGLALATGIRIGAAAGANDYARVRTIGIGSMFGSILIMSIFAVVFILGRDSIPQLFVSDPDVIKVAHRLLIIAALFQIFDGLQVVASGSLRGLTDVKIPTAIALGAYWGIALPVGWLLSFPMHFGPVGVWCGLAVGLFLAAISLSWRFYRLSTLRMK